MPQKRGLFGPFFGFTIIAAARGGMELRTNSMQRTLSRIAMLLVQTYLEQSTPLLTPRFRIDGLPCIMTS